MTITLNGTTGIQNVLGSAAAPAESNTTNSNTGVYFPTSTSVGFSANGAVALAVDSTTNIFYIGGLEKGRFDSSGNLLVGTTSTSTTNGGLVFNPNNGGTGSSAIIIGHKTGTASGDYFNAFIYNGSVIGSITQSGTAAVLFNVTSDQRLKENIQDAEPASALIDALQVRQFDWKTDNTHQRYGFIAQELVTLAPEAVHQPTDPEEMMAVDYSKLVPILIKAHQEQQALITQLTDRIAALEAK